MLEKNIIRQQTRNKDRLDKMNEMVKKLNGSKNEFAKVPLANSSKVPLIAHIVPHTHVDVGWGKTVN